jgi:hypothetical protein
MIKISQSNNHPKTPYLSKVKASDDDMLRLLAFLSYSKKKYLSWFWNKLIDISFVSFVKNTVLLKSGNNFKKLNYLSINQTLEIDKKNYQLRNI